MKERFDHYAVQQVEEGDVRGKDPRQEDEPNGEAAPESKAEEAMGTEAERLVIGIPWKMSVEDEGLGSDGLADGPNPTSERRLHTPVRLAAVKRSYKEHQLGRW